MTVTAVPIQPVKRSYLIWIWLGVAIAIAAAFLLARQGDLDHVTDSGLRYRVITAGTGPHPTDTDYAVIMYEGRLPDGTVFDRSQQPTPLQVKAAVPGFTEALKLMSKGGRYHITIPAKLGYGAKSPEGIPPNSPLIFDVQLLAVVSEQQYQQIMMQQMMMNGGGAGGPGGPGGPGAPPGGAGGAGDEPAPGDTEAPPTKGSDVKPKAK